jgi:RNA polymerase sigma-70 factor (ECF subfamily)
LVKRVRNESDDPTRGPGEAELHAAVARALQTLDDDHRAVIVLRDIEGFDYQEIAKILQVPPGTVKSRLFRARIALQQAIDPALSPGDSKRQGDPRL